MENHHFEYDSSFVCDCSDKLLTQSDNRYSLVMKVARRARQIKHESDRLDPHYLSDPLNKPVIAAIIEMADELDDSLYLQEDNVETFTLQNNVKTPIQQQTVQHKPKSSTQLSLAKTNKQKPDKSLNTKEIQLNQFKGEIGKNPQLLSFKEKSNLELWEELINWINEAICELDLEAAENSVERLITRSSDRTPFEIAHILMVHKSLQAAGVDVVRGIPFIDTLIETYMGISLPSLAKLAAEMVYQIAIIYNWESLNLNVTNVEIQILLAFAATLLGENAIDSGIAWLKMGKLESMCISAGAKAFMIYAIGETACLYYENRTRNLAEDSQNYLDDIHTERDMIYAIEEEIEEYFRPDYIDYTLLSQYLSNQQWKQADQETKNIIYKLIGQNEGSVNYQSLSKVSSDDLMAVDKLWLKYSDNHFGFSVQKSIYWTSKNNIGNFGEAIGWRGKAGNFNGAFGWIEYSDINFSLYAPIGHLPAFWLDIKDSFSINLGHQLNNSFKAILERNDWCREQIHFKTISESVDKFLDNIDKSYT
ncbi:DNA-directed RNA polymerase subunit omega [Pannus brasiliensis CCIBt3594]|uniref:DNA-directed RNA polymerase subunit omega n=1 Tax=Pannus brasiliensis CCIBt3594 TaxID=1427578 RepID=A0AAW9QZR8_9CHRO